MYVSSRPSKDTATTLGGQPRYSAHTKFSGFRVFHMFSSSTLMVRTIKLRRKTSKTGSALVIAIISSFLWSVPVTAGHVTHDAAVPVGPRNLYCCISDSKTIGVETSKMKRGEQRLKRDYDMMERRRRERKKIHRRSWVDIIRWGLDFVLDEID